MSDAKAMPTPYRRAGYIAQNNGGPLKPGQRRRLDHKKNRNVHHRPRHQEFQKDMAAKFPGVKLDLSPAPGTDKTKYTLDHRGRVTTVKTGQGPPTRRGLRRLIRRGRDK